MANSTLFQKYQVERMPFQRPPFGLDEQGQEIGDIRAKVDISNLPDGMYIVQAIIGNTHSTKKLIIR